MKIKSILLLASFALAYSSCRKCVTCTPYSNNNVVNTSFQAVKVCRQAEIESYESGDNFVVNVHFDTLPSLPQYPGPHYTGDTLHFICK